MAATQSEGDFLLFRETLTELERLVDLRNNLLYADPPKTATEEAIFHTLKLLGRYNVNITESSAIEELERLAEMRAKIGRQDDQLYSGLRFGDGTFLERAFDKLINSKIEFIKDGPFSRPIINGGVESMTALERLAAVIGKIGRPQTMHGLLESRIREFVWRPRPKAGSRLDIASLSGCLLIGA